MMKKNKAFKSMSLFAAAAFILMFILGGCGYHVAGSGTSGTALKGDIGTLAVPIFKNTTYRPHIESTITTAIVNELRNSFELTSRGSADSIMEGEITGYELLPVSFTEGDIASEYRLTIVMTVRIVNRESGEIIWELQNTSDYEDFMVTQMSVAATRFDEDEALKKIAVDRARIIRELVLEGL